MKIDITSFNGLIPRVNIGKKPDHAAKVAFNCDLRDGRLRPMKEAVNLQGALPLINADYDDTAPTTSPRTLLYVKRSGGEVIYWWHGEVEVAAAHVEPTEDVRLIVSGFDNIQPPVYLMAGNFGESLDEPLKLARFWKPTLPAPIISFPESQGTERATRWRQSWVDAMGFESDLSESSAEVTYDDGDPVTIGETLAPTGAVSRRVYKIVTGVEDGQDDYSFVFEQDAVHGVFLATTRVVLDENVGEAAPAIEHPPLELGGVIAVPGNFFAGFNTNHRREVLFSDVGLPYSYPLEFRYATGAENVVRLVSVGNGIVALTDDRPIFFSGGAPEAMVMTPTMTHAPLVSRRGVAKIGSVCLFASDDGIYSIQYGAETQGAVNQTAELFDRWAWRALNPETALFGSFNNILHAWFPHAEDERMRCQKYIFGDGLSTLVTHDETAIATTTIPDRGVVALRVAGG